MTVIRTPDERFENLPDFSFRPHYMELPDEKFGSLRMHYLDEGPATGKVILLMHGQGCWTYMFRKMIPILIDGGYRVIAPDYIGFGRSDKLPSTEDYSFQKHIDWLTAFFHGIEFNGVTAYLFDWGGFFGLRIAAEHAEFFDRIALSNTQLPTGDSPGREVVHQLAHRAICIAGISTGGNGQLWREMLHSTRKRLQHSTRRTSTRVLKRPPAVPDDSADISR